MKDVACIIPHIFLPCKLPDGANAENIVHEDTCLLQTFREFLSAQHYDGRPFPNTIQAFNSWGQVQDSQDEALLAQSIADLKAGQSLPVYVRAQNAGLLITLSDAPCDGHPSESAVLSTFAPSQKSSDVSSAVGDLIGSYPSKSIHVPRSELLTSVTLARQIISLNQHLLSEALTKMTKSNNCYDDERDVADPMFVSKWLCGSLCNVDSCLCTTIPQIVKKVRDEVVFGGSGSCSMPFRRSGIWMTIKVILQVLLVKELGPTIGQQMYKIILLKFMCTLCSLESIAADVGVQIMAKIARRLYKTYSLEDLKDPVYARLLDELYKQAEEAITSLRGCLDAEWKAKVDKDLAECKLLLPGNCDFYKDSVHSLVQLVKYTKYRIDCEENVHQDGAGNSVRMHNPDGKPNFTQLSEMPFSKLTYFSSHGEQALQSLHIFEYCVINNLSSNTPVDYEVVGKKFISYLKAAESAYDGDPVGISRTILVCLKILRWVDLAVCGSYALIRQHDTGIPIKIIEHLMLPFSSDLKLAHELETYFTKRSRESTFPSLLAPYNFSYMSCYYSVRHAQSDNSMRHKRQEILNEGEKKALEKREEVREAYSEWNSLKRRIRCRSCLCHQKKYRYRTCDRCHLEREADEMLVDIYEKPLPSNTEFQNAIVFELMIPNPILYYREMFCAFLVHLGVVHSNIYYKSMWRDELRRHVSCNSENLTVSVGSSSEPQSRYYPRKLHPKEDVNKFIVDNTGDIILCSEKNKINLLQDVPAKVLQRFVFKVELGSPYSSLQWTLNDHDYVFSDNQILARQNECPSNLSLNEFKEFGSIRAGHRIQLRNLYRALKQETLSLNTESVLNLIYEVLWRAGPPSMDSDFNAYMYIRESHIDLLNEAFVNEFLSLLGILINKFSENWDDHHNYAAITAIVLRISSINEDKEVLKKCYSHLLKCREILRKWCDKIEIVLDAMQNRPVAEQNKMRKKLVAIATLSACTFWSDVRCGSKVCLVKDVLHWLLPVKTIQEYLGKNDWLNSCSNTFRNQLRRFRECGHSNFRQFHQLISEDPSILQRFTQLVWSGFSNCESQDLTWRCDNGGTPWFLAEVSVGECRTVLQLDILEGHFLVNGRPEDYLPSDLRNHVDFNRIFGYFIIKVQPLTHSPWSAMSKHPFREAHMRFVENLNSQHSDKASPYIISAIDTDKNVLEYVPENVFDGQGMLCVQQFLIRKYTHWWSRSKGHIYFRSKKSHRIDYCLDLETNLIKEQAKGRFAIDNDSSTFRQIMKIFTRLEQENSIEVLLQEHKSVGELHMLDVRLPRMRLHFTVVKEGSCLCVSSLEYPGMKVTKDQKCGTLVQLQSGLMLEPKEKGFSNKLLLIPHGEVKVLMESGRVLIDTTCTALRNPPYFAYEADSTLLQLKCGQTKSASVYLAYLHAVTSYPLPDPFTKHTGTERAMQLLQSGHCWSCEPFDEESLKTLSLIMELSPKRKYNSKKRAMTTVSWPLPNSMSCSDAFQIIVAKLVNDSQRLAVLFESTHGDKHDFASEQRILCEKAYWRNFRYTTKEAHTSSKFLTMQSPSLKENIKFESSFADHNMNTVLKLAFLVDQWDFVPCSAKHTHGYLVNGRSHLRGHLDPFPVLESIVEWHNLEFCDSWLMLYELAKTVKQKNLKAEWKIILTSYVFKGISEEQLLLLHTIAVFPENFVDPPDCEGYEDPDETKFDRSKIQSSIRSHILVNYDLFLQMNPDPDNDDSEMSELYKQRLKSQIDGLTYKLEGIDWPFRSCGSIVDGYCGDRSFLDLKSIKESVDILLNKWFRNYQFKKFIDSVENTVMQLGKLRQFIKLDVTHVCNRLSLDTPLNNDNQTKKLIEFSIYDVQAKIELPGAYDEARTTFKNDAIAKRAAYRIRANILSDQESAIADTAINRIPLDILSDPSSGTCKIWERLIACLRVDSSSLNSGLHHSKNRAKAIGYDVELANQIKRSYELYEEVQMRNWKLVEAALMSDPLVKLLTTAGIYQRITPLTILPLIAQEERTLSRFQNNLRNALGAFGVAVTCKKHALRCLKYLKSNNRFELERELASPPHENWSPADRPEWLLFEIEMDLVIRPIQKQVAEHMENPEYGLNAVTQLNMGEGKTAVITPLLILSMTNKKQLCRVTVLRSLFNINKQALGFSLGGLLLNRRIYTFPCRRDIQMSEDVLGKMFDIYKECMDKGGVNLTTPAYRLSFHLKTYEQCQAGQDPGAATMFLQIQDWLKRNARDILDESDEILHAKYQLVYALGMQMPIVGGSERWGLLQRLLGFIPEVVKTLDATEGSGFVELFQDESRIGGTFPRCRLLKLNIYERFCEMLANRILNSTEFPNLQVQEKALLHTFLTKQAIDTSLTQQIFELFSSNLCSTFLEKALILRGLMACSVLFVTLNKRWRVNYGVSPNGRSLLAVPFRAKDVAAERTEFGHVDVALVLTHLSYYYSGLSESQVRDCLYHVKKGPNPEMEYGGWISTIENPDPSIISFRRINPEDPLLRIEKLFPALRRNKAVIDYWLGNIVLPVQLKQFPSKMISTAWDLASDQAHKATTGFSGTNDTQILLPLTIAQKDLPELRRTNFEVFQNLLSEENSHYESLPGGAMSLDILKKLVKNDIPVLLDVGALMLDLNNEDIAKRWLSLASKGSKNAVVYFSKEDRLMVMDRSSPISVPFEISPFRSMLDQCVIYLDDVHTRGTDLKFPSGMQGCVTLGKGVTKDKLVQGCMRMRKLGKGHTVCFWASNEVNNEIIAMVGPDARVSSAQVLKWALNNSRNTIRDEFVYWVVAACNYISKTVAQKHYDSTTKMDSDRAMLAEQASVAEVTDLKEMYGNPCSNALFPAIAAQLLQKYCPGGGGADVALLTYKQRVVEHCKIYVSDLEKRMHLLDEEQERELQQEQEEERELERPGAAKPCTPVLHEAMVEFLKTKYKIMDMENMPFWAQHLPEGLHCTRLDEHNESAAWGKYIFVTADFLRTVEELGLKDSYLRTVNWIVAFMVNNSLCWLLVSPFEVNHMIPMFRSKQMKASLHMYAARLSSTQSTLLDHDNLVLPVGVTQSLTSTPGFYDLNASLCIFAGCIYFQNQTEFESYCALTGYVPNPRSAEEEQALAKMVIDNTGFLLPSGRQRLRPKCIFQRNPERLIVGVINCRYNYFSRLCHVARLLLECQKPNFDET